MYTTGIESKILLPLIVTVLPLAVTETPPAPTRLIRLLSFVTAAGTTFVEVPLVMTPKSHVMASN